MIEAQRRRLVEGLKVYRLRLMMGTSMGCMHGFMWRQRWPDFVQAMMPMACLPVEIAGHNRMWRRAVIEGIKSDPAWQGGNYKSQPVMGLSVAASLTQVVGAVPLYLQTEYDSREDADVYIVERIAASLQGPDANDIIYQFASSRIYNTWPD